MKRLWWHPWSWRKNASHFKKSIRNLNKAVLLFLLLAFGFLFIKNHVNMRWIWLALSLLIFIILALKIKFIFLSLITIISCFGLVSINNYFKQEVKINQFTQIIVKIKNSSTNPILASYKGLTLLLDGYELYSHQLYVDEILQIDGFFNSINFGSDRYDEDYLKSLKVDYIFQVKKIEIINSEPSLKQKFHNMFNSYDLKSKAYFDLLFLNTKTHGNFQIYDLSKENGVAHLFIISGFHFNLYYSTLRLPFRKIRKGSNIIESFILLILLVYVYLIGFPIPAFRAFLMICFAKISRNVFKCKINPLTNIASVASMFLIWNPYVIFNYSFILSFLATTCVIVVNKMDWKHKFSHFIALAFFVNFAALPIVIYFNNSYNLLSIVNSIILTPLICLISYLMPLMLVFPFVATWMFGLLDVLMYQSSRWNFLLKVENWNFVKSLWFYFGYVISLTLIFKIRTYKKTNALPRSFQYYS